ncbi:nicotinamide mononucleotide transporter [Lewinella antarctica]|uniref:Nicotinamide riboside transporter PnuC n=1 Tax=Neolewinella antarctica TaxID=442734 RepID=A0ABX0XCY8_9BACT|nr:nicotinamide mononucleotide transporter [Neolewinella antarctica]
MSTAVWGYQSLVVYELVSDAILQLFYLIMAGVGVWQWQRGGDKGGQLPVTRMTMPQHLALIVFAGTGGSALGLFFNTTLQAAATYPDAITTAFSIGATFLLIRRKLENWLYWIVIDAVYVWIYRGQGAHLFALMMVINIMVAAYGFFTWRRELTREHQIAAAG